MTLMKVMMMEFSIGFSPQMIRICKPITIDTD